MRAPDVSRLLDALDLGRGEQPIPRALLLLQAWRDDEPREALAAMPVGRIVARLLELRASVLGSRLECVATCPACGATLESELFIPELLANHPAEVATSVQIDLDGAAVECRLPTSADLLTLHGDPRAAVDGLVARLLRAKDARHATNPAARAAIEAAIAECDPLAHIELTLSCGGCGHRWPEALRPFEFVWTELQAAARRITSEVAQLAAGFGWREADILAMSEHRRRRYLEMLPA